MPNQINDKKTIQYIDSLITTDLEELENIARSFEIPIVKKEVCKLLEVLVKIKKPRRILEIGTAIGYSSIVFAKSVDANIVTIEIDDYIGSIAKEIIGKFGYEDRIEVVIGDANDEIPKLEGSFDFVFMDRAKGQYSRYFEKIDPILEDGGVLVSDNILFKGYVSHPDETPRRDRTIVRRLREYLDILTSREGLTTSILPIDDGLAISVKEGANYEEN